MWLEQGRVYKFDQSDLTNWYHLIGFAYEPDGAAAPEPVDELEPSISRGGNTCTETATCPAPMYFMDGVYQGSYSNIEYLKSVTENDDDFGLDAVEPLFFRPLGTWQEYGAFETYLNFDYELVDHDIFYFCHVRLFNLNKFSSKM